MWSPPRPRGSPYPLRSGLSMGEPVDLGERAQTFLQSHPVESASILPRLAPRLRDFAGAHAVDQDVADDRRAVLAERLVAPGQHLPRLHLVVGEAVRLLGPPFVGEFE